MTDALFPYQERGAEFLAARRRAILADPMGSGKTRQFIAGADRIGARRIIHACPAIARETMAREWRQAQTIKRSIQIIEGSADLKRLQDGVLIPSYAMLDKLVQSLPDGFRCDLVIGDEAQALKTATTHRTRAFYGRRGLIARTSRIWLASGTLAPNHPGELWVHYAALLSGKLSCTQFIARYCRTRQHPQFGLQILGANLERAAELAAIFAPYTLRRRLEEILPDLPPLRWGHVVVGPSQVPEQPDLTPEELAILGKFERDENVTVVEAMKLASLRRWTGRAKAPAVLELLQHELQQIEKIVCVTYHREVTDLLAQGLGPIAGVIDGRTSPTQRQALIDGFQNTERPRVLLLQITTGGTAINLHRSNRVIFSESDWVPGNMAQSAKRCHRLGQRQSVHASVVSLAGSVDEVVGAVLTRKAAELATIESHLTERAA